MPAAIHTFPHAASVIFTFGHLAWITFRTTPLLGGARFRKIRAQVIFKAAREHLGTQAEVAAMLGVNRVTVAKRENGTMTITNEAVLAIQSLRRPRGKRKSENKEISDGRALAKQFAASGVRRFAACKSENPPV